MGEDLRVATEGELNLREEEPFEEMTAKVKAITVNGIRIKNSFYIDEK